jgi:hypothetical protein
VLIGYKGNDIDAAAFYCPYVPLTSSGVIIDPQTFEPVVSFLTRYGFIALTNSASSLGNAADYLGLVGINSSTLSFIKTLQREKILKPGRKARFSVITNLPNQIWFRAHCIFMIFYYLVRL